VDDVAAACEQAGGRWERLADAKEALGVSQGATASILQRAVREGVLVEEPGPRGARSFRLAAMGRAEVSQQGARSRCRAPTQGRGQMNRQSRSR
jgi:hypothetical protein